MATNDLMVELQKDSIKLDDDSEKKVVKMLLRLLEDKNGEVQNLAVKCLGPLVSKVKEYQVETIVDTLCTNMLSDKEQLRDISSIGLKTVIAELPPASSVILPFCWVWLHCYHYHQYHICVTLFSREGNRCPYLAWLACDSRAMATWLNQLPSEIAQPATYLYQSIKAIILLIIMYHPPSADESVFFRVEQHMEVAPGEARVQNVLWVEDFNVHHQELLVPGQHCSSSTTDRAGQVLKDLAARLGL
eukprot:g41287.t1